MNEEIIGNGDSNLSSESNESVASFKEKGIIFVIMVAVILADQFSKYLIEKWIPYHTSWMPIESLAPFFQITRTGNTGGAFGLFPSASIIFTIFPIIVSIFIIFYNRTIPAKNYLYRIALGLMLGGALGNLVDRFRQGYVTDFLDFGPWPIFNLADFFVVSGAVFLGLLMLRDEQKELKRLKEEEQAAENQLADQDEGAEEQNILLNE